MVAVAKHLQGPSIHLLFYGCVGTSKAGGYGADKTPPEELIQRILWPESLVESGGATRPAEQSLLLSCTASGFTFEDYGIDWYRQALEKGPEWVSHTDPAGRNLLFAETVRGCFSISRNTKDQLYLQLDNLQAGDSGHYYCPWTAALLPQKLSGTTLGPVSHRSTGPRSQRQHSWQEMSLGWKMVSGREHLEADDTFLVSALPGSENPL
uniref:Ig-like domain-containing protein n=1 Tax=Ornithorhynchus anatinus TaxID=9258 RepID=F7GAT6_ORNAN